MFKYFIVFFLIISNFAMANIKVFAVRYRKNAREYSYDIKVPRLEYSKKNMNEINSEFQKIAKTMISDIIDEGKELKKLDSIVDAQGNMSFLIYKNDFNILSILMEKYVYFGGAHGLTTFSSYNFSQISGDLLNFKDIFKPEAEEYFKTKILEIINQENLKDDLDSSKIVFFENPDVSLDTAIMYFEGNNVVFSYPQYSIAPYSSGTPKFKFSKDEIQNLMVD